jgi:hypothetical protein
MLGYRSILDRLDVFPLPEHEDGLTTLTKDFARAVRMRRRLTRQVEEFLQGITGRSETLEELPLELREFAYSFQRANTLVQTGPDHLVLATALSKAADHFPMRGVYNTVAATAAAMLYQLALGADCPEDSLPLRGGIEMAAGAFVQPECFVYSPALTFAYDLESKKAIYPRTLAGVRFLKFLEVQSTEATTTFSDGYEAQLARKVRSFFFNDADGEVALDFMGESVRQNISDPDLAKTLAERAWMFMLGALRAAKERGDQKVALKYEWLSDYMSPRLGFWGVR